MDIIISEASADLSRVMGGDGKALVLLIHHIGMGQQGILRLERSAGRSGYLGWHCTEGESSFVICAEAKAWLPTCFLDQEVRLREGVLGHRHQSHPLSCSWGQQGS